MNAIDTTYITKKFEKMGARIKYGELQPPRFLHPELVAERPPLTIDVQKDKAGQYFEVLVKPTFMPVLAMNVLDIQVRDRHLLLMTKTPGAKAGQVTIAKFLCGHDERFWFVAAVPEKRAATSVKAAKEALKPDIARDSQLRNGVKAKYIQSRKNAGYVRQGEWFFIPAPDLVVDDLWVLQKEPLSRGRGKPHVAQFFCRVGGTTVYVCDQYPDGLEEYAYQRVIAKEPDKKHLVWRTMVRDPFAHVKGWVRHPDHKTIVLPYWHRVVPNTEYQSAAGRNLAFLD